MKNRKKRNGFFVGMIAWLLIVSFAQANVRVKDLSVKPRWPWNGMVDITYSIECDEYKGNGDKMDVYVSFMGIDNVLKRDIPMFSLTGDGVGEPVTSGGPYKVTWDAAKDYPTLNSYSFSVKVQASGPLYMVVDISKGTTATSYPVNYTNTPPLNDNANKSSKLWLRRIPAGTFIMGSPQGELGRSNDEVQHQVTITRDFYIGVYEFTQAQYLNIQKNANFTYSGSPTAANYISYDLIRGSSTTAGGGWPLYGHKVDAGSFMGLLQTKTGLIFDLPTEAQWEYACRAGTTTALNSGKNLTKETGVDGELSKVGMSRNKNSNGDGYLASGGNFIPNAWGLYDMHGNVYELCLDWYGAYESGPVCDPTGPESTSVNTNHVVRGGSYDTEPKFCRSASRASSYSSSGKSAYVGFRVVCLP